MEVEKTQSRSFCKGSNRCVTNCHLKDSYGDPKDGTELVKYLTTSCQYTILPDSEKERIMITDVSCQTGIKHVIVYILHSKISNYSSNLRPSEDELAVTVSFLDTYGKPSPGFNRCLLDFSKFAEYIYKHQKKQGRYIFSKTKEECIGPRFINKINGIRSLSKCNNLFLSPPPTNPYVQNVNIQNHNKSTFVQSASLSYPQVGSYVSRYSPNTGDISIQNSDQRNVVHDTSSTFPKVNSYVSSYSPDRNKNDLPMSQPLMQSNVSRTIKQTSVPSCSYSPQVKDYSNRLCMSQPMAKSSSSISYDQSSLPYVTPNGKQKSVLCNTISSNKVMLPPNNFRNHQLQSATTKKKYTYGTPNQTVTMNNELKLTPEHATSKQTSVLSQPVHTSL